ncbi:uncharacterized protein LOC120186483 [Hibiscus syriacus]|uniref:uncharacterized protein LOC120186483 n=1 Tax=Hibiscus syriacus TaxID=106335 RepID=UPI00192254D2|nr:uncharacterized protein LOC120186483 [Hibiscus syriacus]
MDVSTPLRLLELNLISAQDLEPIVRRGMKTYAVAWVNPKRKLTTRIDTEGHTNPTWNDKFIFRVDDEFLSSETSAVMVEIYAVHWFRDIHVGTVRIIIGNLLKTSSSDQCLEFELGMRFVALQVRRPSGRPQGILNIGLTLLDGSRRSMPLYMQMGSSAVGYQYFMGEDEPVQSSDRNNNNNRFSFEPIKHELRRTLSDSSSMLGSQYVPMISFKGSSIFNTGGGGGPALKYDSDLGPSPSEVAAAVANIKNQNKMDDAESSLVGSWSLDESMEGIVSKLERWRVELPPMYDHDRDDDSDGSRVSSSSLGKRSKCREEKKNLHQAPSKGGLSLL